MPRSGRQNRLTSQVGEYLVVAELARRGLIATTFAGNVPDYDVVATDEHGRHVSVQVKTSNSDSWQFNISSFCSIRFQGKRQILGRAHRSHVRKLLAILVRLSSDSEVRDRFFVLTWTKLRNIIVAAHREWLSLHNGVRPRNTRSLHTALNVEQVQRYENRWKNVFDNLY